MLASSCKGTQLGLVPPFSFPLIAINTLDDLACDSAREDDGWILLGCASMLTQ